MVFEKWVGMESGVNTVAIITTTTTILCCLLALRWWRQDRGLPPGPYGLPLVGYLPWLDPQAPHLSLSSLVGRYGRVFSLRMGGVLVVVMADPQIIRDTLSNKYTAGRAPLYLTHGIMKGYGLICSEGEMWREHRKFVLGYMRDLGMRTTATRGAMEPKIQAVATALVQELCENGGEDVDVSGPLLHHVGNLMNQLVFGETYSETDPTWRWLRHLLEEGTKLIGVAGPLNFLPWLRFLPMYRRTISFITENQRLSHQEYQAIIDRYQAQVQEDQAQVHGDQGQSDGRCGEGQEETSAKLEDPEENVTPQFEDRQTEMKDHVEDSQEVQNQLEEGQEEAKKQHEGRCEELREGQDDRGKNKTGKVQADRDLLSSSVPQHLVDAYLKERCSRGEEVGSFTLEQLHHVAADLFGAGSETTITTLKWHLLNMALFPDVQRQVQEELDGHAPGDAPVGMAEADLLPYTQATLLETQRLRSILPLGIPHGATQEVMVGGYRVPAGTMLLPLLWSVHHDPTAWTDPYQYRPARFMDASGRVTKGNQAFMPFQTGRRVCIGDEFAKMILFTFTTTLLKGLNVGLGVGVEGDPSADPVCGISLTPRPYTLIFTSRNRKE